MQPGWERVRDWVKRVSRCDPLHVFMVQSPGGWWYFYHRGELVLRVHDRTAERKEWLGRVINKAITHRRLCTVVKAIDIVELHMTIGSKTDRQALRLAQAVEAWFGESNAEDWLYCGDPEEEWALDEEWFEF